MNLVKKNPYLCIGVLLALLGLQGVQGVQSLVQLSRLSAATGDVVAAGRLAGESRALWARFVDAEQAFKQATSFVDAGSADDLRKAFGERSAALRQAVAALQSNAPADLRQGVASVSAKVDAWLLLAARHVGAEGVTELPSYHVVDAARVAVEAEVGALADRSSEVAAATVAAGQSLARGAALWTLGELGAGVVLGMLLGWQALRSLQRQLGADATEVARVANAMADGDLRTAIATQGVPDGSVMAAMARMQRSLTQTVGQVLAISGSLADGSAEIATGNGDLSERTERQAAALERTAATMDQLGTTVRHNAASSSQASQLAEHASSVATRGSAVVGHVVETMKRHP